MLVAKNCPLRGSKKTCAMAHLQRCKEWRCEEGFFHFIVLLKIFFEGCKVNTFSKIIRSKFCKTNIKFSSS